MNTANNSRSKESKRNLRNSLLSLLGSKELSDISVTELCRAAGVNRSTFYAHYNNLWEVMDELEEKMDMMLMEEFKWVKDKTEAMLDIKSFRILTKLISQYPMFYKARLNNPSMRAGKLKLGMEYIMNDIIKPYAEKCNATHLLPYYMAFGRAGVFEVLELWVNNNCKESYEEIADLLYKMTIKHNIKIYENKPR